MADLDRRRRFVVPEVVQTSAMDCGPASLKCLLEGFGIRASYGRLREACQTDVDGTSIDAIEEVAGELGLEAAQVMAPVDQVLLTETSLLPAIAVVRLPTGVTHFVVVWRRHGSMVQLMDPATGRRWTTCRRFLGDLYVHETLVPAAAWRAWAGSEQSLATLRTQLSRRGVRSPAIERVLTRAEADPGWWGLASADASARMTAALVGTGAVSRGAEATRLFERLYMHCVEQPTKEPGLVPQQYWSAREPTEPAHDQLSVRGAVLVTVGRTRERKARVPAGADSAEPVRPKLSPELVAALEQAPAGPWRTILGLVRRGGALAPVILLSALVLATLGVVVESLLLRSLFDIGSHLPLAGQRATLMLGICSLVCAVLLLEFPIAAVAFRLGRHIETRLRIAFLEKIPRLGDAYFRSRPISDMTERSHSIQQVRLLPDLGAQLVRAAFELVLTTGAIAWIDPASTPIAILLAGVSLGLPLVVQPVLMEYDLRVRTHAGAISRFYLDAFLGLIAVRAHGAERALRHEHHALVLEWGRAALALQRAAVAVEAAQLVTGFGLAAWLLFNRLGASADLGSTLLLAYWTLKLPMLGQEIGRVAWQYPGHRNLMLRLVEPLGAPDTDAVPSDLQRTAQARQAAAAPGPLTAQRHPGVSIRLEGVTVCAAGRHILRDISLDISSGSHVAIVGASGAGKSSLVGLILGWHRAAAGRVLIDEAAHNGASVERLRSETAWVDPTVYLWNRSLLENVRYGAPEGQAARIGAAIDTAELAELLELLPDGMQTRLGEGGGRLSGGESQRVRLARALMRHDARLVILDEPFSGLEPERRQRLLEQARALWRDATLLCITHDIAETRSFSRVLLMDDGRIAEDAAPECLETQPGSRYRAMLDEEEGLRRLLRGNPTWRALNLEDSKLCDVSPT